MRRLYFFNLLKCYFNYRHRIRLHWHHMLCYQSYYLQHTD
jgi:hypothetical protein